MTALSTGRCSKGALWPAWYSLAALPIHLDPDTAAQAFGRTLSLAEKQGLNLYDASYLELALHLILPLASLDKKLRHAAAACGVALLGREAAA